MSDEPVHETGRNPNLYALTPAHAFMLGTLVGLIDQSLKGTESALSVSPVADHEGNYLRLVRFTLDDGPAGTYSWVLALVTE